MASLHQWAARKWTQLMSTRRVVFRHQLTVSSFFPTRSSFPFSNRWLDVEGESGSLIFKSEWTTFFLYQVSLKPSRSGLTQFRSWVHSIMEPNPSWHTGTQWELRKKWRDNSKEPSVKWGQMLQTSSVVFKDMLPDLQRFFLNSVFPIMIVGWTSKIFFTINLNSGKGWNFWCIFKFTFKSKITIKFFPV